MMKCCNSIALFPGLAALALLSAHLAAEEEKDVMEYVSPKGSYHIEWNDQAEPFIVSTRNSAERAPLPDANGGHDPAECQVEFYYSPDESWLFYTEHWRHHGVREQELYHRESGVKFAPLKGKKWFAQTVRSYAIKNGGFKKADFLEKRDENHLETMFRCWSFDSSRLLFGIYGDVRERGPFYVYFNTRTKTLEQTPYLRELNKNIPKNLPERPADVVCAEPTEPLPPEAELKARLDGLDEKLNKRYTERTSALGKEDADELREKGEAWVKARDEGVKMYLRFAPKGEEERRRLQFLAGVTTARLESSTSNSIGSL
ncbi:MAG: hypothetical protein ACR2ID_10560 [Chthoniobacterales bacterium]